MKLQERGSSFLRNLKKTQTDHKGTFKNWSFLAGISFASLMLQYDTLNIKLGGPVGQFMSPFFRNFLTPAKRQKKPSPINQKKATGNKLTGAPFCPIPYPPPLLPPPLSNNIIPITRELVFFLTLRHNARGGRCHSVGEIGINFSPAKFVRDKTHDSVKVCACTHNPH